MKNTIYKISNRAVVFLWLFVWATGWSPACYAQQQEVVFEAWSDAKEVVVNGYFDVSFTLKNAEGSAFRPPSFKDFTIVAGPATSTSMQIINGRVSRQMSYTYTLRPHKEGTFIIGSAAIKANGKIWKTTPLTIKVVKGNGKKGGVGNGKDEVFVQLEPAKTQARPGEQISLDYKLYTTVSIDGYDIEEEPEYKGFFVQELRRFNSRRKREVVNGQQMTTIVLRRLALFPQQTGTLTIPPAGIQLAIVEDDGRGGFFFRKNIRPVLIRTQPVDIFVKELPPGAPENFSGAVGQYEFKASVNKRQVTTDEAVSVIMMITGDGDMKRIQPPPLLLSDSFEIYPPKIIEENTFENQGRLIGKKIIEYLILPKYPGHYTLSPSFSYFNTTTNTYETITAGPYPLFVKQGTDRHAGSQFRQEELRANDIRFIKRQTQLKKKGRPFVGSPVFIAALCLPLLAFTGLFILKKSKNTLPVADERGMRAKRANKMALQRLSAARIFLDNNAGKEFYNEISKALLGYASDKTGIPLSELSKENVKEKLLSFGVGPAIVGDYMEIIKKSELALFAGMDNSSNMETVYKKAVAIIEEIEKEIVNRERK